MSSISWKRDSFWCFHMFLYRSLIIDLCFVLLLSLKRIFFVLGGYIPSSFPWFVNTRLKSSCLVVTTSSLHHCIWDCLPVLSLIDFCHKVDISCLIDPGVIPKPWDWSTMVLCMPLIKTILAHVLQVVTFIQLEVKHRTSHMRFFCLWSVNTYRLAP